MAQDSRIDRMKELVRILDEASRAYYVENREIMSNLEFDALYDELAALEEETGIVLASSPTQKVGYEAVDDLPKEDHDSPMLSLGKTKDREEMRSFVGAHTVLLSWKLDGLTVVLTYSGGQLQKAVTRGNGVTGDVITPNAKVFRNIPLRIAYQGELVLRGEAVITYPDFEKINESIGESGAQYKNPRNLCSGSVRQLNSEITAQRSVRFYAFALVKADGVDFHNSRAKQFEFLEQQGFEVVEYMPVTAQNLDDAFAYFEEKIKTFEIPSDGLVALYDDIAYGESLGRTAKTPRNALAFKWQDEAADTILEKIEWSCAASTISPVAIFQPVELEGTTVKRASLCNISECERLGIGTKGTEISVIKANKIIPKVIQVKRTEGSLEIPHECPVCHAKTEIRISEASGTKTLHCTNAECPAKQLKKFARFVSKEGMNIDGISEQTLAKFINLGWVSDYADLYNLRSHIRELANMEGFGEKSASNIMRSIDRSAQVEAHRLLYALNIPLCGLDVCKRLLGAYPIDELVAATVKETGDLFEPYQEASEVFAHVNGIGPEKSASFVNWFRDAHNMQRYQHLREKIEVTQASNEPTGNRCEGLTFVVTGDVHHYKNRNELKAYIESQGGKVASAVSGSTNFLINNDVTSTSGKNQKAKQLGIPIISEDEFVERFRD